MPMRHRGGRGRRPPHLERQRALLQNMIQVTREQRRYLIEADLRRVEQTNRLLGALLESQKALHEESTLQEDAAESEDSVDQEAAAELRELAQTLRQESRTNYLLACRGAEFARFSLSLLAEAGEDGEEGKQPEAEAVPRRPRLVDRPA